MDRSGSRRRVRFRAWLIAVAAASLTACQGLSQQAQRAEGPDSAAPSWRVVERLGAARYLSPSMASWEQVTARGIIPAGSQVSTGIGGRLIVSQAANQLSAGTNTRFILPERGGNVRQTAGWLRYRIAGPSSTGFGIETPSLDLAVDRAVLDVTVADDVTEVAVVSGRVHVKTLDERRQIDLHAGYTGYASLHGAPLALRRGVGLALETVPVTVMPALHPGRPAAAPTAAPAPAAMAVPAVMAATPAAAAAPTAVKATAAETPPPTVPDPVQAPATIVAVAAAAVPAPMIPANDQAHPGNVVDNRPHGAMAIAAAIPRDPAGGTEAAPVLMVPAVAAVGPSATATAPKEEPKTLEPGLLPAGSQAPRSAAAPAESQENGSEPLRQRFDRLTENLLDGLAPALPPMLQGSRR